MCHVNITTGATASVTTGVTGVTFTTERIGVTTSKDCKVCMSGNRPAIERMLAEGSPIREVDRWVLERGENISRGSIHRHYQNHMNPADKDNDETEKGAHKPEKATPYKYGATHESPAKGM